MGTYNNTTVQSSVTRHCVYYTKANINYIIVFAIIVT